MRTFSQYVEDIATDFGRQVVATGISGSHADVLATLARAVESASKNPAFAGKIARMVVSAAEQDEEVRSAIGGDFEPSAFVADVVAAARSNSKAMARNKPPSGETVAPNLSDSPAIPEE